LDTGSIPVWSSLSCLQAAGRFIAPNTYTCFEACRWGRLFFTSANDPKESGRDDMITSTSNPQIKNLILLGKKAKARYEQGVFIVEGKKMVREAPREWIQNIYVSESYLTRKEHQDGLLGMEYELLSDHVLKAAAGTQTPQGILAVVRIPQWDFFRVFQADPVCCLLLEGIQDPGNLGTMLRTAEAAGITAVIASPETADLYNPKTIRATMGSIYRMPYFAPDDFYGALSDLKRRGIRIYAAHLKGSVSYDAPDYRGACAFMIGNEGKGLTGTAVGLADAAVKIPMQGKAESLNAAVTASVLMYESSRQRRG